MVCAHSFRGISRKKSARVEFCGIDTHAPEVHPFEIRRIPLVGRCTVASLPRCWIARHDGGTPRAALSLRTSLIQRAWNLED